MPIEWPNNCLIFSPADIPGVPAFRYILTPHNGAFLEMRDDGAGNLEALKGVMACLNEHFREVDLDAAHLQGREIWCNPNLPLQPAGELMAGQAPLQAGLYNRIVSALFRHPLGYAGLMDGRRDRDEGANHEAAYRMVAGWFGDDAIETLTAEQATVFFELLGNTRRALIEGVAGSGKTIIARALARRLSAEGKKVLLLCQNNELAVLNAELLAKDRIDCFSIETITQFIPFSLVSRNLSELEELVDNPVNGILFNQLRYDALILDEAQGMDMVESLQQLIRPDENRQKPLYVFHDPRQHSGIIPEFPKDLKQYRLELNCRNALAINQYITDSITKKSIPSRRGMPEGEVNINYVPVWNQDDLLSRCSNLIGVLMSEHGAEQKQIAILTCKAKRVASYRLDDDLKWGNIMFNLVRHGIQWRAGKGIFIGNVDDFRGMEADFVILILPQDAILSKHYIGASRAKKSLSVISVKPRFPKKP